MAVDGVGKPGPGGAPIDPASGASPTAGAQSFEEVLGSKSAEAAGSAEAAQGSAELASLQRGEISLDQYLDGRVLEATSHLEGRLAQDKLEFIRETLRAQLETDPVLSEWVQRVKQTAGETQP